jgi:hypothetical protein
MTAPVSDRRHAHRPNNGDRRYPATIFQNCHFYGHFFTILFLRCESRGIDRQLMGDIAGDAACHDHVPVTKSGARGVRQKSPPRIGTYGWPSHYRQRDMDGRPRIGDVDGLPFLW